MIEERRGQVRRKTIFLRPIALAIQAIYGCGVQRPLMLYEHFKNNGTVIRRWGHRL